MIVTDHLVFINFPKTGSTFVRTVLKRLYGRERRRAAKFFRLRLPDAGCKYGKLRELMVPNLHTTLASGKVISDQHGCVDQIPKQYAHLPVVTVTRHPFDRYVSMYKFGWWAENPCLDDGELRKYFPTFPDLSFPEFVEYHRLRYRGLAQRYRVTGKLGPHALQFAVMHFRGHERVLRRWEPSYVASGEYRNDLPRLEVLRNESLADDLFHLLARYGFEKDDIEFIRHERRIQPPEGTARTAADTWTRHFDGDLARTVAQEESALLRIYRDFGVDYATNALS